MDREGVVSRNDVLYTTPSPEPWEAMPVGGGDLSAMVRWDGSLHLHLTKSDCWGYQAPADAPLGTRVFNNVSPGHLRLGFGPGAVAAASRRFRQRLDLYRGRVLIEIGEGDEAACIQVWGHPVLRALAVEVSDPAGLLGALEVELTEWRDSMEVSCADRCLRAREVQTRPARPHLAGAGMEEYFPEGVDPLAGRGTAVVVSSPDVQAERCSAAGRAASLVLHQNASGAFRVLVAAVVTESGDPVEAAVAEMDRMVNVPADVLRRQQRDWWEEYWGRSFVRVTSPNGSARWLNAAYYVHLYTLGCTNRGGVPAKWDGGAGLMRGDERNWGISEWVQEVRFTYMPLYAANRLEMARGLCDYYSGMSDYLKVQTGRMWGLPGMWIPETVTPWGHVEDWVLDDHAPDEFAGAWWPWDPATSPYGVFHHFNPYIGFLFTAGLEVCQHYLTWVRYSGDEAFRRERAYPVIRDVCVFVTSLLHKGDDGCYHLDPANALETWWMARDPADTLDGLRAILPEAIRLAEELEAEHKRAAEGVSAEEDAGGDGDGDDAALADRWREVLAALPEPARGWWKEDATIESDADVYAPAGGFPEPLTRVNRENPQLYRVYPFGLSGSDSEDRDLARQTFEKRICALNDGWSMDAIWAARLGLGEEACDLLTRHAARFNRFRYGGWDSNDNSGFPDGLAVAPFLDAGGCSAFALQEILLQSHGGVLRIAPAVASTWSGVFRLRAEGGFLVTADVAEGTVQMAEIESLWGGACVVANPWPGECAVLRQGEAVARTSGRRVAFETRRGARYLLVNSEDSVEGFAVTPVKDQRNELPGLPGRDG